MTNKTNIIADYIIYSNLKTRLKCVILDIICNIQAYPIFKNTHRTLVLKNHNKLRYNTLEELRLQRLHWNHFKTLLKSSVEKKNKNKETHCSITLSSSLIGSREWSNVPKGRSRIRSQRATYLGLSHLDAISHFGSSRQQIAQKSFRSIPSNNFNNKWMTINFEIFPKKNYENYAGTLSSLLFC